MKRFPDDILSPLNEIDEKLRELRELILAILVMTGEIPAAVFNEEGE